MSISPIKPILDCETNRSNSTHHFMLIRNAQEALLDGVMNELLVDPLKTAVLVIETEEHLEQITRVQDALDNLGALIDSAMEYLEADYRREINTPIHQDGANPVARWTAKIFLNAALSASTYDESIRHLSFFVPESYLIHTEERCALICKFKELTNILLQIDAQEGYDLFQDAPLLAAINSFDKCWWSLSEKEQSGHAQSLDGCFELMKGNLRAMREEVQAFQRQAAAFDAEVLKALEDPISRDLFKFE